MSYCKLHETLISSSIWGECDPTRIVWVTMLALKNDAGEVLASLPGLARLASVPVEAAEAAVELLSAPDPYSRTPDYEGRRIEAIEGGWVVLNHELYREKGSREDARRRNSERQKRWRDRQKSNGGVTPHNGGVTHQATYTDTDTDTEEEEVPGSPVAPVAPLPPLPSNPPPRRKRTGAYSEEFEQFWSSYRAPSKGSKKKAWSAWRALGSKRPPAFVLVAAFEAQEGAAKRKRALKQFVPEFPHAERWLRDERFDDEVDDPSAPPVHEAVPQEPLPENWAELVAELYPEIEIPSDPADLHPSVARELRQLAEKRKGGRS